MNSQNYINIELNLILNSLKSKSSSVNEAAIKQLTSFINKYREYTDDIVSKITQFFNGNTDVSDKVMIKVINSVLKVLTEKNTQIINFLNLIFPLLFHIIFYANRSIEYYKL